MHRIADASRAAIADTRPLAGAVVACNPTAVGYSGTNVGIAKIAAAGPAFTHIIEDGSPADTTMDGTLNAPPVSASAMPANGTYVEGLFVRNSTPAASNGQVLFGRLRLTTGSSNVAGTDWVPVFGSTSREPAPHTPENQS